MQRIKSTISKAKKPKDVDNLKRMGRFLSISAVFMFSYVLFTFGLGIALQTGYFAVSGTILFAGLALSLCLGGFARAMTFPKKTG